jgi:acetyl esterase/lipase
MNNKIKAIILLCLASLFGTAHAQVSSLTASVSGSTVTLNWGSFSSSHFIRENGNTVSQTSSNSATFNKAPGSYSYMVSSCGSYGQPYCIYSNTVYVTVQAAVPPPPPTPPPLEFTVGSLQEFMALADGKDKTLANFVGDEIRTLLQNANLVLNENGLTYSENLPNEQIRSGCSKNIALRNLQVNASLNNASRFEIIMDTLSKPIVANTQLIGTIEAGGTVRVRMGFKVFGECIRYLKASVDGSVRTDFTINASMVLMLNPTLATDSPAGEIRININPQATLSGKMAVSNTSATVSNANLSVLGINVFSGVIGNLVEKQLLKLANNSINGYISGNLNTLSIQVNSYFGQYLQTAQAELNNKLAALPRQYRIPAPPELRPQMLGDLMNYALNYFPPAEFLNANSTELLYLLLVGDDKRIRERVGTSLACNMTVGSLSQNMARANQPGLYRTTTMTEFCSKLDDKNWLGNAEPAVSGYNGSDYWTLTPATTFKLTHDVAPTENNYQPYMQRVHYRSITDISDGTRTVIDYAAFGAAMQACQQQYRGQCPPHLMPNMNNYITFVPIVRGTGTCKLEMRVYKRDVNQAGLKPLLAIHGGGWKYRGLSFYGMESQISHFTDQGFVVFAPFYRLAGDIDANTECNKATGEQINQDVDAALTWVQNNMTGYGVTPGERVRLFGQSAGAQLAGWLLTHRPNDVQKALLMYAPGDAQDYINNYQAYTSGQPYSPAYTGAFSGRGVEYSEAYLSTVPGTPGNLRDISPTSSLVLNNSFPGIVAGSPSYYPPVFLVHGRQDQIVPAIQSVRLCNAYTGNPASGPASILSGGLYNCGNSRLGLVDGAAHGFELCVPGIICAILPSSFTTARNYLNESRTWLAQ